MPIGHTGSALHISGSSRTMQQAIAFSDIGFAYDDTPVIEQVSISVKTGGFLLVLGPNGGGKTTFGKLMLGLLTPSHGTVKLFGQAPAQMLSQVGYVPQMATAVSGFPIRVSEVVRLGLYGQTGHSRRDKQRLIEEALDQVAISHLAQRGFSELSGGERQRVLIARALVSKPRLLFLDEPTANVDMQSKDGIHSVLAELAGKTTIVLITHDLEIGDLPVTDIAYINRCLMHTKGRNIAKAIHAASQPGCLCRTADSFANDQAVAMDRVANQVASNV